MNSAEIASGLAKLKVKGSVLYIAAHPDDENTRLLAYLAREKNLRTGYLSLTRGDGGQNLIGNEQGELLGLIRTQELLAARRVDGAEQFFTRANDFGFSKTAEETLKLWDHEQILSDVVWVIRKFRPDVIITRFPPDARAGHGHHASSAILAHEAFKVAADPKRFPEQLKWVKPWQAKRIFWNTFNFGGTNTTSPDQLKIDVGGYNASLGKSYGEIAAISRTNHKSQGFGSGLQRGEAFEFFSFTDGTPAKSDLFEGIALDVEPTLVKNIEHIQQSFDAQNPSKSITQLIALKKNVGNKNFNQDLLNQLILACAGFWAEVNVAETSYAVGDEVKGKLQAIVRANVNAKLGVFDLEKNKLMSQDTKFIASESQFTQPYWLANQHTAFSYKIDKQEDVGYPENPNPLVIKETIKIDDVAIPVEIPIVYKSVDPVKGELYQPVVIAPKVTASLADKAYVFTNGETKAIAVRLKSFTANAKGTLTPKLPEGWTSQPSKIEFSLSEKGEEQVVVFNIKPSAKNPSGDLELSVNIDGKMENKGLRTIRYDHIPAITFFPEAKASVANIDLKIGGKNIAYIDGAGDLVGEALTQVGYQVTHFSPSSALLQDFSKYDAVVTGIRLFNVSTEMKSLMPKLLDYVKNGGVLVHQYNVSNGLKSNNFGPYPFSIVNKRVTEEDAKVTFSKPNDSSLNFPNKITTKDFDGWVQERGIYFATGTDEKYIAPLSMNDKNEEANNGSLLVTNYGKGKFVYTSLVFYRELPAGVPGAFRLFANLLTKPQ